jgi:hypothetical protein
LPIKFFFLDYIRAIFSSFRFPVLIQKQYFTFVLRSLSLVKPNYQAKSSQARMHFSSPLIALAALAPGVRATPFLIPRDNCTTYSPVAAGTVCYHTPSDCSATYLVQSGDSCTSIATTFNNFTLIQFYYWNPDVEQTCLRLRAYVPVCINTPWYDSVSPVQEAPGVGWERRTRLLF